VGSLGFEIALKVVPGLANGLKNGGTQDWTTLGWGAGADLGNIVKVIGKYAGTEASKKAFGQSAYIIETTVLIITLLEQLNGFGSPDKGDKLGGSSASFSLEYERLQSAFPRQGTEGWEGSGSEAYAAANTALRQLVKQLSNLDKQTASIMKAQAGQVQDTRIWLAASKSGLTFTIPVALFILATWGEPAFTGFQLTASGAAMAVVIKKLYWLMQEATARRDDLHSSTYEYNQVAAKAAEIAPGDDPFTAPAQRAAESSEVSSFEDISNSMSGVPTSGPVPQAPLRARTGVAGTSGDDTSAETPDQTTPTTSTVAMPTVAQLAQAATLPTPRGRGAAAAPANKAAAGEPTPAVDVEHAGAAPGTESAELAPVGAEEAQGPSPAGRVR